MSLPAECYLVQRQRWPRSGRHILAQYDDSSIVVYQAFSRGIASFAVSHQRFGGDFSYRRMSWVKPNFLWMMCRSDWGRAENQEAVLAIRLRREFFDSLLEAAVPSTFLPDLYSSREVWSAAIQTSDVRLQWDPDHLPTGEATQRRAIQLGLRGVALQAYGQREILEVIDVSDFVAEQRELASPSDWNRLRTPIERVYIPSSGSIARRIGLSVSDAE